MKSLPCCFSSLNEHVKSITNPVVNASSVGHGYELTDKITINLLGYKPALDEVYHFRFDIFFGKQHNFEASSEREHGLGAHVNV